MKIIVAHFGAGLIMEFFLWIRNNKGTICPPFKDFSGTNWPDLSDAGKVRGEGFSFAVRADERLLSVEFIVNGSF